MYSRSFSLTLVALPYSRKGCAVPEMSRLRYAFALCYGALYWVLHELPLWKCWAFFVLYTILLVTVEVKTQGVAYPKELIYYLGYPMLAGFAFSAAFATALTTLRTVFLIVRLACRIFKPARH